MWKPKITILLLLVVRNHRNDIQSYSVSIANKIATIIVNGEIAFKGRNMILCAIDGVYNSLMYPIMFLQKKYI